MTEIKDLSSGLRDAIKAHYEVAKFFDKAKHIQTDEQTDLQIIALFMTAKTMRTQQALVSLAREGMAEDMYVLLRTIYESMVTLKFLRQAPEEELKKWRARVILSQRQMIQVSEKLFGDVFADQNKRKEIFEGAEVVHQEFFDGVKNWWKEETLAKQAEVVGQEEHDFIYGHTSAFAHPGPYAATSYIKNRGDHWEVITIQPNYTGAETVLWQSASYISVIIDHYNDICQVGLTKEDYEPVEVIFEQHFEHKTEKV